MSREIVQKIVAETRDALSNVESKDWKKTEIEISKAFNKIIAATDPKLWDWYLGLAYIELRRTDLSSNATLNDSDFIRSLRDNYTTFNISNMRPSILSSVAIYELYRQLVRLQFPQQPFQFSFDKPIPTNEEERQVAIKRIQIHLTKFAPFLSFIMPMSQRLGQYPKVFQYLLTPLVGLVDVVLGSIWFVGVFLPFLVSMLFYHLHVEVLIPMITLGRANEIIGIELTKFRKKSELEYGAQKAVFDAPKNEASYNNFLAKLTEAEHEKDRNYPCIFNRELWDNSKEFVTNSELEFILSFKAWSLQCKAFLDSLVAWEVTPAKKVLFILLWPFRFLIGILLLLLSATFLAFNHFMRIVGKVVSEILITVGSIVRFILSLPHYVAEKPGEFLASTAAMVAVVGLTMLAFGLNPLLLGIAAGAGFVSALVMSHSKLAFFENPTAKIVFGFLLMGAAIGLVFLPMFFPAFSIPVLHTLSAIMPTALPIQIAIAIGIGVAVVALPTLFASVVKLGVSLKEWCFPSKVFKEITEIPDGDNKNRVSLAGDPQLSTVPSTPVVSQENLKVGEPVKGDVSTVVLVNVGKGAIQ